MSTLRYTIVAEPVLAVTSTRATSISISWTSAGVNVMYTLRWQRDISVGCTDHHYDSTAVTDHSSLSYNVTGLHEDSRYRIAITASNSRIPSDTVSNTATAMTMQAGE